jgi:hypothetical protein
MRSPGEAVLVTREDGQADVISKINLIDYSPRHPLQMGEGRAKDGERRKMGVEA